MAHFAKIIDGIVTEVLVVSDEHENNGESFLNGIGLEGRWIQTSYNTSGGQHSAGGAPLRYNYAGIGYTYDEARDAFIPPQPFPSWLLNEDTCLWDPPVPYPQDGNLYQWDESTTSWVPAGNGNA